MPSKASRPPATGWVPFLSPSLPYPHVYQRAASPAGRLAVQDRVHRLKVGAHGSLCEAWERRGSGCSSHRGSGRSIRPDATTVHPPRSPPSHSRSSIPTIQPQKSKGTKLGRSPPVRSLTPPSAAASRMGGRPAPRLPSAKAPLRPPLSLLLHCHLA